MMKAPSTSRNHAVTKEMRPWLWVWACAVMIIAAIPFARGIQKFVYAAFGSAFFTYIVFAVISIGLGTLLYLLKFRLKVTGAARYIWLFICAGLYAYITISFKKYPEEALHLIEYALLSYLLFRALSYRIKDQTIYAIITFIVLIFGILDEFIQWLTPGRVWGYSDVGLNALAGGLFMLCLAMGIRPEGVKRPVKKNSVRLLAAVMTTAFILLGLCLLNTPSAVNQFSSYMPSLSWLRSEEPMTNFNAKTALSGIAAAIAATWLIAAIWLKMIDD